MAGWRAPACCSSNAVFDHAIKFLDNKIGDGRLRIEQHRGALEAGERVELSVPIEYTPILRKPVPAGEVFISLMWEPRHDGKGSPT